jgi:hypothetical protein
MPSSHGVEGQSGASESTSIEPHKSRNLDPMSELTEPDAKQLKLFDRYWQVLQEHHDHEVVMRLHAAGLLARRKPSGRTPAMYRLPQTED